MARARLLKPGFFTNDALAEVSAMGRLIFAGLWTIADREGRLEDRPKRIKAELLPYDDVDADPLLEELAQRGFISRYESQGLRVIQISSFAKHQSPHPKEPPSRLPSMDESVTSQCPVTDETGTSPSVAVAVAGSSVAVAEADNSQPSVGEPRKARAKPPDLDDEYLARKQREEPTLDIRAFAADYLNWTGSAKHKDKRQGFENQLRIPWKRTQFTRPEAVAAGAVRNGKVSGSSTLERLRADGALDE